MIYIILIMVILFFIIIPKKNKYKNKSLHDWKKIYKEIGEEKRKTIDNSKPFKDWEAQKIFTNEELKFYKLLIEYFQNKNIFILTKIRIADLVKTNKKIEYSNYMKTFRSITQKHIDYVLTDYNGKILCLIELDGKSHNYSKTQKNDLFKNNFFEELNIPLLRFQNYSNHNLSRLDKYINKKVEI